MKRILFSLVVLLTTYSAVSQNSETRGNRVVEVNYFYSTIIEHSPEIAHLITGHPRGMLLAFNWKSFGGKEWQRHYNFPDYGLSVRFQDMINPHLGDNFGVYGHYNFYFLNRHLMLRVAQGLAYNTNPYDPDTNYDNIVYGTHLQTSTYFLINYIHKNIAGGLGIQAGIDLTHYSNGNFKAPNTSTNTYSVNVGLNYTLDHDQTFSYQRRKTIKNYSEPVHLNVFVRSGVHTSDVIGTLQYAFINLGAFADKRLSYKSSLQLGAEYFITPMLDELIHYRSIAYPKDGLSGNESSARIGAFAGYQLHLGKTSFFGNFGYYVYQPYDFEGKIYLRAGIQREFFENFFGSFSVRAHAAKAEALEFTIGYRL